MRPLTFHNRNRNRGFTLIELLIVVAVIGIIAAILIPNLLDALQKAKQKRTVADMRDLGAAWFSWLTDQVSAAAAGSSQTYNFDGWLPEALTADDLVSTLYISDKMFYTRDVPEHDGWARDYNYRWAGDPSAAQVIGIRSLGRDGAIGPTTDPYPSGPFLSSDYDEDIVWADGFFIRYPVGQAVQ